MGHRNYGLPNKDWKLFTRGGTNDVFIQEFDSDNDFPKGNEINIPSELLRELVADDIRTEMIGKLEQMDTNSILQLAVISLKKE